MIECYEYKPPADAIEALARCLYPVMVAYFESDEGQREFAERQERRGTETSSELAEKKNAQADGGKEREQSRSLSV